MTGTRLNSRLLTGILAAGVILATGLLAVMYFHGAHEAGHSIHGAAPQLTLNAGQKWAADAPLRTGMERIRTLVRDYRSGHSDVRTVNYAAALRDQVDFLIENCKLEPAADATLHVLIADILKGADLIDKGDDAEGAFARLQKAMDAYPAYFDHPGW